jgi:hypothetical protein
MSMVLRTAMRCDSVGKLLKNVYGFKQNGEVYFSKQ